MSSRLRVSRRWCRRALLSGLIVCASARAAEPAAPRWSGSFWLDDLGAAVTGTQQLGIAARRLDPGSRVEQVDLAGVISRGLRFGQLGLRVPLGRGGLRVDAALSGLNWRSLEGSTAVAGYRGSIAGGQFALVRPLASGHEISLQLGVRGVTDDADAGPVRDRRLFTLGAAWRAAGADAWGGGGLTRAHLALAAGSVNLARLPSDVAADATGAGVAGAFATLRWGVDRAQWLAPGWSLYGAVHGQLAAANLDPSEQFSLGGPYAVRAYPTGEATGDEGWVGTAELRRDLALAAPAGLQLVAFVDAGGITLRHDAGSPAGPPPGGRNHYALWGWGGGLVWYRPGCCQLRATWARPVGSDPGRAPGGPDAEWGATGPRWWLQAAASY